MDLWFQRDDGWTRVVVGAGVRIGRDADGRLAAGDVVREPLGAVVAFAEHGRPRAALVVENGAGLVVNGFPPLPVRVLADRDEIAVPSRPGAAVVLTTCTPAEPRPFVAAGHPERCGRCRQELRAGDACVRCPACGAAYHQGRLAAAPGGDGGVAGGEPAACDAAGGNAATGETRACWTYDERCGACRRERAQMAWTPAAAGQQDETDDGDAAEEVVEGEGGRAAT